MKKKQDLNILLLQVREDDETILEEFYCFAEKSQLTPQQITSLNPIQQNNIDWHNIDGYDAIFVGGSSDVSVLHPEKYPFIDNCKQLLVDCYEKDIPVFASCFGFQVAVEAFGGKVEEDLENKETGIYKIYHTDTAKNDLIHHDSPAQLWAVSGHKERAITLPKGVIELQYSDLCPYHGFKFPNKNFYAFQFHPEMNSMDLHARIQRYQSRYFVEDDELADILTTSTQDTKDANDLLLKFVDRILLNAK